MISTMVPELKFCEPCRTTAATLMNVVSSRSHAVFTVTLHQV
jgi:hypothetical protein